MTATVDFLVETATDVLYVANASLRYRPDRGNDDGRDGETDAPREARQAGDEAMHPLPHPGATPRGRRPPNRGMLWTLDENGELTMVPVRTGISDGTNTVVMGRTLEAGPAGDRRSVEQRRLNRQFEFALPAAEQRQSPTRPAVPGRDLIMTTNRRHRPERSEQDLRHGQQPGPRPAAAST